MTRERARPPAAVTVLEAASLVIDGFQPVRSRWTWQPLLPELWLREQERHHFRETTFDLKKKV